MASSGQPARLGHPLDWLAQYLFDSIEEVQEYATRWLWTYNHERPNMGLGGITPIQKLAMVA
jgi:putative transposase